MVKRQAFRKPSWMDHIEDGQHYFQKMAGAGGDSQAYALCMWHLLIAKQGVPRDIEESAGWLRDTTDVPELNALLIRGVPYWRGVALRAISDWEALPSDQQEHAISVAREVGVYP